MRVSRLFGDRLRNGRRVTGRQDSSFNSGRSDGREPQQSVETERRPPDGRPGRARVCSSRVRTSRTSAGAVVTDLEADDRAEAALRELELDRFEEVVGIVRESEVGIARHPKDGQRLDRPADHVVEEVNDQVLEQDAGASRADADEPGHAVGDVHANETPLARHGVGHDRADVERERRERTGTAPPNQRRSASAAARSHGRTALSALAARAACTRRPTRCGCPRPQAPAEARRATARPGPLAGRAHAFAPPRASASPCVHRATGARPWTRPVRGSRPCARRRTRRGSTRRSRTASRVRVAERRGLPRARAPAGRSRATTARG